MNLYAVAPSISFIFLLLGGIYIARKGTRRIFNWVFTFAVFVLAIMEFCNLMLFISSDKIKALFWQRWILALLLFMPICWTLLSLMFARANYRASIKKWGWYLGTLSIFTLCFLAFLPKKLLINDVGVLVKGYGFTLGRTGHYLFMFLLLSLVVILLNFENTYRQVKEKQKIKYLVRGIGIIVGSYIILSSLALLFSYIDSRFTTLGSIAIIIGFSMIFRSILKFGLADADVYVGRQAVYTSATLSIVGGYLFIIGLIARLFLKFGFNISSFLSFLAAFFAFFLFISIIFSRSLKHRLTLFIDRSFYKDKYDYRREWANLGERLGIMLNENELISQIKRIVKQVLIVESAELVLNDTDTDLMQWLLRYGEAITVEELSRKQPKLYEGSRQLLENSGAHILISLNAKQKLLGVLAVGRKADEKDFTNEDKELLKIISRQVSITILNARLSEELIASRQMENFHKFSSFLVHDLKNFVSMLSMIAQNAKDNFNNPEFQRDSMDTISGTIAKMNNLMQKLSTLPKELELKAKPTDINALIEETINKTKIENVSSIRLSRVLSSVPELYVDAEYIQRVIQNLLLNAVESMQNGGSITISTQHPTPDTLHPVPSVSNGRYVEIAVSDTGCGMSREFIQQRLFKPFQSSKRKGIGIGLYQCRTIVEAHGGEILVESEEGKGTTFMVRLPVDRS